MISFFHQIPSAFVVKKDGSIERAKPQNQSKFKLSLTPISFLHIRQNVNISTASITALQSLTFLCLCLPPRCNLVENY